MNVAQSRGVAVDYDPFSGSESALAYDSTEAQREIWINSQISEEASCAYNESISLRLEGRLYEDLLASSLEKMIARHEALRSTFSEDGSGVTVLTSLEHPLLILDTGLEEYLAWDSSTAFNLRDGPLFRCALLHRDHKLHELVLTVHGIVCDARSLAVILEDLGELYTAGIEGRLPDLGDREDFSLFAGRDRDLRQSARYRDDADYWRMAFASLPPDLDLPADRRRPSLRSTSARRARIACRPGSQARLREIASENAVSMTELLLAAFSAFLSKLTGKTDLVVATPIAGSSAHLMRASVGQCANLLPLRSSIEPGATFLDLLALVKRSMSDAVEHSAYSYGAILDELRMARDPSRMPLLSTAFSHTRRLPADALRFGELSAAYSFNPRSSEIFEIRVDAVEGPESLELLMHCSEALFTAETMDRRVREFETLLADICLRPEAAIDDLSMLSAQEEELVLRGWNDTARSYPNVELLNRIYEQRAALMPEAVAISDSTRSFTHGEFNGQVERLRRSLVSLGTGPGDRVGVHMRRSIDMVVALYGITAAGAAYVPLDPDYPVLRLKAIIDDAGISTVCTHSSLPGLGIPVKNLLCVDELADQPGDAQASAAASASPEDTAYIIYTSGSTGSPKGVEISHRSIANRLYWMQEAFAVTGKDRVLQKTPFTFDVSVWEFFWPMLFGSTLVVAPPDIHRDARALVDFIKEQGITIVHFVPSMFEAFLEEPTVRECASIRTIICSGEALPVALCRRCAAALPDARSLQSLRPDGGGGGRELA